MAGDIVGVEWDSPGADYCSLNTNSVVYPSRGSEWSITVDDDITIQLTCFDTDGSSTASIDLAVQNTVLRMSGSYGHTDYGSYKFVSWTSENVTTCEASGDWSGDVPIEATDYQVGPVYGMADFNLTCTGPEGSITTGVTAHSRPLIDAGIGSVAAKSTTISSGASITISYEHVGANECRALRVPTTELDQAVAWRDSFDGYWSEFRGQYPMELVAGLPFSSERLTGNYTTGPITEDSAILVNCISGGQYMDKEKTVLTVDVQ